MSNRTWNGLFYLSLVGEGGRLNPSAAKDVRTPCGVDIGRVLGLKRMEVEEMKCTEAENVAQRRATFREGPSRTWNNNQFEGVPRHNSKARGKIPATKPQS